MLDNAPQFDDTVYARSVRDEQSPDTEHSRAGDEASTACRVLAKTSRSAATVNPATTTNAPHIQSGTCRSTAMFSMIRCSPGRGAMGRAARHMRRSVLAVTCRIEVEPGRLSLFAASIESPFCRAEHLVEPRGAGRWLVLPVSRPRGAALARQRRRLGAVFALLVTPSALRKQALLLGLAGAFILRAAAIFSGAALLQRGGSWCSHSPCC